MRDQGTSDGPTGAPPGLAAIASSSVRTRHPASMLSPDGRTYFVEAPADSGSFGTALVQREKLCDNFGTGYIDHLLLGDFMEGFYARFRCAADYSHFIPGAGRLKFHFKLSGRNTVEFANGECATVSTGQMGVLLQPDGLRKLDCLPCDVAENSLTITCRPEVFTSVLGLDPDSLPAPLDFRALERGDRFFLRTMPLVASAKKMLEEMLHCPHSGRFSHVHATARALDLICVVLDVLMAGRERQGLRLSSRDQRMIEAIRSYLSERFMTPPTIAELARMAAMNRTKLTQGFRELFQESISDYCQRLRMSRARQLLAEGEPVGKVAAAVGYEHHSSFSQAFRAWFGFSPLEAGRGHPCDHARRDGCHSPK